MFYLQTYAKLKKEDNMIPYEEICRRHALYHHLQQNRQRAIYDLLQQNKHNFSLAGTSATGSPGLLHLVGSSMAAHPVGWLVGGAVAAGALAYALCSKDNNKD